MLNVRSATGAGLQSRSKKFAKMLQIHGESRQDWIQNTPVPVFCPKGLVLAQKTGDRGVLAAADIFLFEDFRLDQRGEGLSRRDERGVFVPVAIGPRTVDVLAALVERPGELVLKEEIMAAVWGRTVVENANLTVQISALRRMLDQGRSEGSCIQTVAARGYRFAAPVTRVECHA